MGWRKASWNSDSICCHRFNLPPGFHTSDARRHPIRGGPALGIKLYGIIAKNLSFDADRAAKNNASRSEGGKKYFVSQWRSYCCSSSVRSRGPQQHSGFSQAPEFRGLRIASQIFPTS